MTKFSDEEFLLIENLINEIAKEDKNSKKQLNFSNEEKSGKREDNYITETITWDISFKDEPFHFRFNKHFSPDDKEPEFRDKVQESIWRLKNKK